MRLNELQKSFYDTFAFISVYENMITKEYLKKRKYKLDKIDEKILRNLHDIFKLEVSFYIFKELSIKWCMTFQKDIVVSGMDVINVIKK